MVMLYLLSQDQQFVLPIALIHQHNGSYAGRPLDDQDGVRFVLTEKPIEEGVAAATLIGYTMLKWLQAYPTFF